MNPEPASIRIFLPHGRPDGLRIAEISNWSGKALACPRSDIADLLVREELKGPGVYILLGTDPETGRPAVYVGEAEAVASRLKGHQGRDFWVQVIAFVSKDDNLTKAHVKFLEGELIARAGVVDRAAVQNAQASGAKLPESDSAEMRSYLGRIYQLLPILGTTLFEPIEEAPREQSNLECRIKGLLAKGRRTPLGFVVLKGSQAVYEHRKSATHFRVLRESLMQSGVLSLEGDHLKFTRDYEFSSPSAAAAVVRGGNSNGLLHWKSPSGQTLKDLEAGTS